MYRFPCASFLSVSTLKNGKNHFFHPLLSRPKCWFLLANEFNLLFFIIHHKWSNQIEKLQKLQNEKWKIEKLKKFQDFLKKLELQKLSKINELGKNQRS